MKKVSFRFSRTELLCAVAFIVSALCLFARIYPIIFAVHDDMRNYTLVRSHELLANALHSAKQGRISHLWNHLLLGFPFILNKVWFYKLVQFSSFLFDIWAMMLFVSRHIDRRLAWMCGTAAVSFANISPAHNVIISYAFCHQIPIGLIFLSLYFFMIPPEIRKRRHTVFSTLLFLAACMIYEAFLPFLIVFALAAALRTKRSGLSFPELAKGVLRQILPLFAAACAYTAVYLLWQHFYPPSYAGISFYPYEPFLSLKVLVTYSFSLFPLLQSVFLAVGEGMTARALIGETNLIGAVKALLTAASVCTVTVKCSKKMKFRGELCIMGTAVFIPTLLIAFSTQHTDEFRRHATQYVPSFYSYLFLCVFLCILCCTLYRTTNGRNLRTLFITFTGAVTVLSSLSADCINLHWQQHYDTLDRRYRNFDRAVSSEEVTECDSGWQIYAPDNVGIHFLEHFTIDYIELYDDTPAAHYTYEEQKLEDGLETLCMRSDVNYYLMALGDTGDDLTTEEVTIVTVMPKTFDIVLYTSNGQSVQFDAVKDGDVLRCASGSFDLSRRIEAVPET